MRLPCEGSATESARRSFFAESGYLVLPGLLPASLVDRLVPEVDRSVNDGLRTRAIAACADPWPAADPPPVMELELPTHGELLVHEPVLRVVAELMGSPFVFHHLHSDRHDPGAPGKAWHHDHEPNDVGDRDLVMVHALHYLGGLDGTIGRPGPALSRSPDPARTPTTRSAGGTPYGLIERAASDGRPRPCDRGIRCPSVEPRETIEANPIRPLSFARAPRDADGRGGGPLACRWRAVGMPLGYVGICGNPSGPQGAGSA